MLPLLTNFPSSIHFLLHSPEEQHQQLSHTLLHYLFHETTASRKSWIFNSCNASGILFLKQRPSITQLHITTSGLQLSSFHIPLNNFKAVPNFPFLVITLIKVAYVKISGLHLYAIISFHNLFASCVFPKTHQPLRITFHVFISRQNPNLFIPMKQSFSFFNMLVPTHPHQKSL